MKEIVIISGKGGTGKTSLVACFAFLAKKAVFADCDVDAADLHLILDPKIRQRQEFKSGHEALIRQEDCTGCGLCAQHCRFDAVISGTAGAPFRIDPTACEGCGVCVRFCPEQAIDFPERLCGEWYISDTRFGPLVHARLGIAAENSGKLVSLVRQEARRIAQERSADLVIVDGPPGIGCPVIASITGADAVVAVTEPTLSGSHDLNRVMDLAGHFNIPLFLVINKWDINPETAARIQADAAAAGAFFLGRIPYDREITAAQIAGQSVAERGESPATSEIRTIWETLCQKTKL